MESLNQTNKSKFVRTYLSVDCVVFGFDQNSGLNVLLVKKRPDSLHTERQRKLPGSLIYNEENLDHAAQRVLLELTGIKKMTLRQFRCFADPNRASAADDASWMDQEYQPNIDRIVTVAYISICKINQKINSTKYDTVDWFPIDKIPILPFDHNLIVGEALTEIRNWIKSDFSLIFQLLSKKFTIRQLHQIHNALSEKKIDIKNFHKKVCGLDYLIALEEKETHVLHRAARYYKFDPKIYKQSYSKFLK